MYWRWVRICRAITSRRFRIEYNYHGGWDLITRPDLLCFKKIKNTNQNKIQYGYLFLRLQCRVVNPDTNPHWLWSAGTGSALGIRIRARIQEGKITKNIKVRKFHVLQSRWSLLRDKDFCMEAWTSLYEGPGVKNCIWSENWIFYLALKF